MLLAVLEPFRTKVGSKTSPKGPPGEPLGDPWDPLGAPWDALGIPLGPPRRPWGPPWGTLGSLWGALGCPLGPFGSFLAAPGSFFESLGASGELFAHFWVFCVTLCICCRFFSIDLVGFLVRFRWADAGQKLDRSWADARQLQTFLNHSEIGNQILCRC